MPLNLSLNLKLPGDIRTQRSPFVAAQKTVVDQQTGTVVVAVVLQQPFEIVAWAHLEEHRHVPTKACLQGSSHHVPAAFLVGG